MDRMEMDVERVTQNQRAHAKRSLKIWIEAHPGGCAPTGQPISTSNRSADNRSGTTCPRRRCACHPRQSLSRAVRGKRSALHALSSKGGFRRARERRDLPYRQVGFFTSIPPGKRVCLTIHGCRKNEPWLSSARPAGKF